MPSGKNIFLYAFVMLTILLELEPKYVHILPQSFYQQSSKYQ